MSWGNCQRVPAVLWIVVPPLLYPATFHQEREPGSGVKTVTTQCDGKKLFEPSIFLQANICWQFHVLVNQVETKISEHSGAL